MVSESQGIVLQVREIHKYTFKSMNSQGISFSICPKICERVSLLAKVVSFPKNSYEGIYFYGFFSNFIVIVFVLDGQ